MSQASRTEPPSGDLRVFIRRGVLLLLVPAGVGLAALTVLLAVTNPGRSAGFYVIVAILGLAFLSLTVVTPFQLRYPVMVFGRHGGWWARPSFRFGEPRYRFIRWGEIGSLGVVNTGAGPFLQIWTKDNPRPRFASKRFWTAKPSAVAYLWFLTLRRTEPRQGNRSPGEGEGSRPHLALPPPGADGQPATGVVAAEYAHRVAAPLGRCQVTRDELGSSVEQEKPIRSTSGVGSVSLMESA